MNIVTDALLEMWEVISEAFGNDKALKILKGLLRPEVYNEVLEIIIKADGIGIVMGAFVLKKIR